ncbi:hypothetical protein [Limnobacter sp.]|uniref:hypothetical protein n=1 Tax=Limnobacter sp. TaxID=2003368 RepID=UPI002FE13BCF
MHSINSTSNINLSINELPSENNSQNEISSTATAASEKMRSHQGTEETKLSFAHYMQPIPEKKAIKIFQDTPPMPSILNESTQSESTPLMGKLNKICNMVKSLASSSVKNIADLSTWVKSNPLLKMLAGFFVVALGVALAGFSALGSDPAMAVISPLLIGGGLFMAGSGIRSGPAKLNS